MIIQLKKMSISAYTLRSTSFIIKIPHCDALNCKGTVDILLSSIYFNVWISFFIWIQSFPAEPLLSLCVPHGTTFSFMFHSGWTGASAPLCALYYPLAEKFCTRWRAGIHADCITLVNFHTSWFITWFWAQVFSSQFFLFFSQFSHDMLTFTFSYILSHILSHIHMTHFINPMIKINIKISLV